MARRIFSSLAKPALVVAFASVIGAFQSASAAPCDAEISSLKSELETVCSHRVCDGLSHKLDNASHKLDQGKFDLAARRLADFASTMEMVAHGGRSGITTASYTYLMNPFQDAMYCVNNGGRPAPGDDTNTGGGGLPGPIDLPF